MNYFGEMNEFKMGTRGRPPTKPDIMVMVERCLRMGIPLVSGGVMDQPVIWSAQFDEVIEITRMFADLEAKRG